ncbi:MAG: MFS transporter, partial [Dehalococcoidia bacterium]|nr:MFS transporter [Dehalococcoidia bacterium]
MSERRALDRFRASVHFLSALRYPQYRRFWLGNLASVTGFQMMWVAQGWIIYELTDSALYLGWAGLVSAAPAIVLNIAGGVFADRMDQKKLIAWVQAGSAAAVFVLATLIALDMVAVWHVLAAAFLVGALQSLSNPARQAMFPYLLDRKDLMNAVALNSMVWQGTRVVAPAAGG